MREVGDTKTETTEELAAMSTKELLAKGRGAASEVINARVASFLGL